MDRKLNSRRGTYFALAVLAVAMLLAAVLIASEGGEESSSRYVSLGDSFSAGMGIKPRDPDSSEACSRSTKSYAFEVQSLFDFDSFDSVTCAGATINDMYTDQPSESGPIASPQLDALNGQETMISFSISGNDAGFWSTVMQCLQNPDPKATPCIDEYVFGDTDRQRQRVDAIRPRLEQLFDDIAERSPDARIYVMGYQRILPEGAKGCKGKIDVSAADADWFDSWQRYLNEMVEASAEAHGAEYLDIYTLSDGHDACKAKGVRWIEPIIGASGAHILHPNAAGHEAMTQLFQRSLSASPPTGN